MKKENLMCKQYFILTGAMGAGKSTLLKILQDKQISTIPEPAREIIAQQRAIEGEGIYDRDPKLFHHLMLSRSIFQYQQYQSYSRSVIFDRGIADNIGYARLFGLDDTPAMNAAKLYRYHDQVFFLKGWKEIYQTDEDRLMPFEQAHQFGEMVKKIYEDLGYEILEVPLLSPEKRVDFIMKIIEKNKKK